MSNSKRVNIIIIVVSLLGVLLYFLMFSNQKSKYQWFKTYNESPKQPYDFGVFNALIKSKGNYLTVKKNQSLSQFIKTSETGSTYLFTGEYCYLTKNELDSLLTFASLGNQLVFISESVPDTLLTLMGEYDSDYKINKLFESKVDIKLLNNNSRLKDYKFNYRYYNKKYNQNIDWQYISEPIMLDYYYEDYEYRAIPLGTINNRTNFIKFTLGEGEVFIHTNPILFTNYALKNKEGFQYINECFNGINTLKVYHDFASKSYKSDAEKMYRKSETPLSFILQQRALKWAWYLLIAAVVLFIAFKLKRQQAIIPVLEQKRNTSIQFIKTLSQLFFAKKENYFMAEKKMSLFLYFIRHKFSISTHQMDEKNLKLLSFKSKVPQTEIVKIFDYYNQVIQSKKRQIDETNLLELYKRINHFYKIHKQNK
jgi:hypothetical protein